MLQPSQKGSNPIAGQAHAELPDVRDEDAKLIQLFEFHLDGRRLSRNTIDSNYLYATRLLARWTAGTGRGALDTLARGDIDAWLVWLGSEARTRRGQPFSPGYINNLYRGLQQFYVWLSDEEDIPNPMAKMKPPKVGEKIIPHLENEQVVAILKTVEKGKYHDDRRDYAILRLFLSCGLRLDELANLTEDVFDLKNGRATVTGKGNKQRTVKFDSKTAAAIMQYLRIRPSHKLANRKELWLGTNHRPPLTNNGIRQMVVRRSKQAGFRIHPHVFRHNFSHRWLDNGGAEGDLMELNGWSSPSMVRRYGRSARAARAQRAYDRVDVMSGL